MTTTTIRALPPLQTRRLHPIRLIVVPGKHEMSLAAARIMQGKINSTPNPHIGLATGTSPIGTYKELIRYHEAGQLKTEGLTAWNLDDYVLDPKVVALHPEFARQTYSSFMADNLFDALGIPLERRNIPNWRTNDPEGECARYEMALMSRPTKSVVQLLGIGPTEVDQNGNHLGGHIGFNETETSFTAPTHVVELTARTRIANSRLFMSGEEKFNLRLEKDEDPYDKITSGILTQSQIDYFYGEILPRVPKFAMTMGIATILDSADSLLMLVSGDSKKYALRNALMGPRISTPASALWLHPDSTIIADQAAISLFPQLLKPGVRIVNVRQ